MDSKKNPADRARLQVLAEHREIAQLTHKLQTIDDRGDLARCIERLEPLLTRHFAAEESEIDGLHADIRDRSPEQQNALAGLKEEHHEMLGRLRTMLAGLTGGLSIDKLHEQCMELRARLEAHEAKETGLFLDSIWNDIGECD